jgi:hypothetical protein
VLAHAHHSPLYPLYCPATPVSSIARSHLRHPRQIVRRPSRRTFFGLFQKPPRELKELQVEPGYEILINFRSCEAQGHRLPPRDDLLQGFRLFFQHKLKNYKAVNSTQATLAVGLLRHLSRTDGEGGDRLSLQDLRTARDVLLKPPKHFKEDHLDLAQTLYDKIRELTPLALDSVEPENKKSRRNGGGEAAEDFRAYITSLTLYGGSVDAAARLEEYWKELQETGSVYKGAKALWTIVLRGLAKEGREEELVQLQQKIEKELGVQFQPSVHEVMVTFFASRDRIDETKHWFERPIYGKWQSLPETYLEILTFSVRTSQQAWVDPIFQQLQASQPSKPYWDVIFQHAVLCRNFGPEDLRPLMAGATHTNTLSVSKPVKPDIATLNALVRAATLRQDPYLAERFISLISDLGVEPNSKTYLLQLDYRIAARDLGGAAAAYHKLETQYIDDAQLRDDDGYLPTINRYIRALCAASPTPDAEAILDVTRQIERRGAPLEPETVVALCLVFLKLDQEFEVMDTLAVHTAGFSLEERDKVEKAFVSYCLDARNSTARAWDAYSLLRQFFPEAAPRDREQLMDAFFARKRPDMAAFVFGHMRAHANPAQRPTRDTYVRVLEGLARRPDAESLKMVHNMLKMDAAVAPDTRLYNALMLAYLGCGEARKAFEFWGEITASREGPTYRSLEIVFRVCEGMPFGDRRAREIWGKMQRMDLDVPRGVFSAYCGAIAGQGRVEEVKLLIRGMGEADVLT